SLWLGSLLTPILDANQFPPGFRTRLVGGLGAIGLVILMGLLFLAIKKGEARLAQAERWTQRLSPIVPLAALPSLLQTGFWFKHSLEFLILLAAFGLLLERTLRLALVVERGAAVSPNHPARLTKRLAE